MRARLSGLIAAAGVVMAFSAGVLAAQAPGGGGQASGGNSTATGDLLGPDTAEVSVQTGGGPGGTGPGSSGGGSGITCRVVYVGVSGRQEVNMADSVPGLTAIWEAEGGVDPISVIRTCHDASGAIVSQSLIEWSPSAPGALAIDPADLAQMARERMTWPSPTIATSPPLDRGSYAQLSTFFHVSNWEPVTSPPATAGAAWATVTATPVRQSWVIQDTYRGTSETITCDGPGALYDESRPYEAQVPAPCGWTPSHSSDGQTHISPHTGEPCFPSTVTLTWDVSWESNVAPGGPLGEGTSTASVCLVVAEVQATVVDGSGAR